MTTPKTTSPPPAPLGSATKPAESPAAPPESDARKSGELADEQLDKVAGGFMMGIDVNVAKLITPKLIDGIVKQIPVKK